MRLHCKLDLRGTEATEGAVGRGVGTGRAGADADVGAAVRAAGVQGPARQDHGRERAVRAPVHDHLNVLGHERAVGHDPGAMADDGRMSLGRGSEILVTVVDHAHGPDALPGQERGMQGEDRWVFLLASEATARFGLDHPRPIRGQTERLHHGFVHVVGALQRAVDRHATVLGRDRNHGVVLDVELLLVPDPVLAFQDDIGYREPGLQIPAPDLIACEFVV